MRDRYLLPLLVLIGAAMVALSLVWPQGQGAVSPAPFGHPMAPPPPPAIPSAASFDPLRPVTPGDKAADTPAAPAKPAAPKAGPKTSADDIGLRPAQ